MTDNEFELNGEMTMINLKKLLSQMTFEEKVGQLAQYNANVLQDTAADITGPRTHLGLSREQLNYVGSVLNFKSPREVRAIQDAHLAADRNRIPIIFMMDVIHGFRTIYPIPLALGCSFDTDLVSECTRMAAKEATAGGVQVTFTPMVDYVRDAMPGYTDKRAAEEAAIAAIRFDIHLEKVKDHRYLERITQIVPVTDRRYPSQKPENQHLSVEELHLLDSMEYQHRQTDRKLFEERTIVEWRNGRYHLVNLPTEDVLLSIRNNLTLQEEKEFNRDMQIIQQLQERTNSAIPA